jgi:5-methylcytosine-specific restriction endonuclease McrA
MKNTNQIPEGKPVANGNRKVQWQGMNWIKPAKRQAIYDRDGHKCIYCCGNGDDSKLTLDHLKAVELGGTNRASNLVTACLTCNSAKGKKSLKGFLGWLADKGINVDEVKARIRRHTARQLKGYKERM